MSKGWFQGFSSEQQGQKNFYTLKQINYQKVISVYVEVVVVVMGLMFSFED